MSSGAGSWITRRRLLTAAALGAAFILIALLGYGLSANAPDTRIDDSLARNEPVDAPDYRLSVLEHGRLGSRLEESLRPALADGELASEELAGVPYALNFWASWCLPCREEAPLLQQTWQRARERGVLFVGLNMQDVTDDARDFLREFEVDYPNIRDPGDAVARRFGLTGLPETYFIASDGQVVGHVIGKVSADQLEDGIEAAVTGQPARTREGGDRRPTR